MAVETFFIIAVNDDGSLTSHAQWPETPLAANRLATTFDIYQSSKQIVDEFEQQALADRIARTVVASMKPPTTSVPSVVADALKERGINPESITPAD
jgi:hypothetical protein